MAAARCYETDKQGKKERKSAGKKTVTNEKESVHKKAR